jgi:hypothetical protein
MDIARSDQLLADVRQHTIDGLESSKPLTARSSIGETAVEAYERTLLSIIVASLIHHHQALWPSSERSLKSRTLSFGGTIFKVIARDDLWDFAMLEVAYVPVSGDQRVESQFGIDFPLHSPERHSAIRLYPPRMAFPFEFHQDAVVAVVQCVLTTGTGWHEGHPSGE